VIQALKAWGPAAIWAAVLFLLSEKQPGTSDLWDLVPDKVVHLGLYGVLGATLAWGRHRTRRPLSFFLLALAGIVYGASDEWHQSFVPGRTPSAGDILADSVGVVLGLWFLGFLLARRSLEGIPLQS
jgi:VanZ family protein